MGDLLRGEKEKYETANIVFCRSTEAIYQEEKHAVTKEKHLSSGVLSMLSKYIRNVHGLKVNSLMFDIPVEVHQAGKIC